MEAVTSPPPTPKKDGGGGGVCVCGALEAGRWVTMVNLCKESGRVGI